MKTFFTLSILVICLLSHGCGPRSDETTPEMAQRMIKLRGFDSTEEGFFKAIKAKDAPTVKLFLQAGINPNAKNSAGETALTFAAANSDAETIGHLIEKADINQPDNLGNTPLFTALKKKNFETFNFLLKNGADPNGSGTVGNTKNQSALYAAVLIDRPDIIQQLLEKGADPSLPDNGGAVPVSEQIISPSPDLETVQMLLDKMRDVNQAEKDGSTLLIYATKNTRMSANKRLEIINRLLEKGADKNLKDKTGKTALDYAKENKLNEAVELLK